MSIGATKWRARTIPELILEIWEALDCESVGAAELEQIQRALSEKFGTGAVESPAAIARVVADEGAVLRHPEVFNCDLQWRQKKLKTVTLQGGIDLSGLPAAFESMVRLEEKRLELQINGDAKGLEELRAVGTAGRNDSLLRARSKILDQDQKAEAKEISEWLRVWLQSPDLFSDWLDLRRRSPEFRKKFPDG